MKSALTTKELATKNHADLTSLLAEKRHALRTFRFGAAGAKTKNVREGRAIRKDIARIMTELVKKSAPAK